MDTLRSVAPKLDKTGYKVRKAKTPQGYDQTRTFYHLSNQGYPINNIRDNFGLWQEWELVSFANRLPDVVQLSIAD